MKTDALRQKAQASYEEEQLYWQSRRRFLGVIGKAVLVTGVGAVALLRPTRSAFAICRCDSCCESEQNTCVNDYVHCGNTCGKDNCNIDGCSSSVDNCVTRNACQVHDLCSQANSCTGVHQCNGMHDCAGVHGCGGSDFCPGTHTCSGGADQN